MNNEIFFTGRTERFLVEKLKMNGELPFVTIYNCYATRDMAKSFIVKLLEFKIAELDEKPLTLKYMGDTK